MKLRATGLPHLLKEFMKPVNTQSRLMQLEWHQAFTFAECKAVPVFLHAR